MYKRAMTLLVSCALLFQICGCTSMRFLPLNKAEGVLKRKVVVTLLDGSKVACDEGHQEGWQIVPATHVRDDTLYTYVSGQPVKIPLNEIAALSMKQFDFSKTVIFIGASFVTVYGLALVLIMRAMVDPS